MGRITDEEQARPIPAGKAARLDREHRDLLPLLEMIYAISELRQHFDDSLSQFLQASGMYLLIATLWDDVAHLPVISTVEHNQDVVAAKATAGLLWITRLAGQAEPEHIHWWSGLYRLKSSQATYAREATVCSHCKHCPHLVPAILSTILNAVNIPILLNQLLRSCAHHQLKVWIALRLGGNEFEEMQLRDQCNIRIASFQATEIGKRDCALSRLHG